MLTVQEKSVDYAKIIVFIYVKSANYISIQIVLKTCIKNISIVNFLYKNNATVYNHNFFILYQNYLFLHIYLTLINILLILYFLITLASNGLMEIVARFFNLNNKTFKLINRMVVYIVLTLVT